MPKDLIEEVENTSVKTLVDFSPAELKKIRTYRWKARYDPSFLGTRILRMDKLITEFTHGPLLRHLQQFPKPTREQFERNDMVVGGTWNYTPIYEDIRQLPGPRDRLILYPRGSGKTTLNCELHTIQWLLNYPEIALAIFQASIKKSRDILGSIKQHFTDNPTFRAFFPEYCPPIGAKEFGTQDQFTTPARNLYFRRARREESVMTAALEAGLTGYHFEVIKFSDVVTSDNTLTEDQIMKVRDLFDKTKYQSISAGLYWRDVEGTTYHRDDLYSSLIKQYYDDIKREGKSPWSIFVGGCWVKDLPAGRKYMPEELKAANKLTPDGKRISIFPELLPLEILERQEHENIENFRAQMENDPRGGEDGIEIFPEIEKRVITAAQFKTQVNPAYNVIMVDSAQTDTKRANYTALICATVDRFGRLYITKIIHKKLLPDALAATIVKACDDFHPLYLILEKSNFNEGLLPGIRREWDLYPHHIPEVKMTPIDNQKKKQAKIKEALQPAFARGDYRFVTEWIDADAWAACISEHQNFPKTFNDDILDALTAFYEARNWYGREFDRAIPTGGLTPQEYAFMQHAGIQFLDFEKTPEPVNLLTAGNLHDYYRRTGGL